jgi:hypothetical protein
MTRSFGQAIEVGKPLPENEPLVWSGCVEVRKCVKDGTVSYALNYSYEKGDKRIGDLVRGCLYDIRFSDIADQLPVK